MDSSAKQTSVINASLTRRDVLWGASALAATVVLPGCATTPREPVAFDAIPDPSLSAELKPSFAGTMDLPFYETGLTYGEMVRKTFPGLEVEHRHHAGSSSGIVDGAGGLIVASP